VHFHEHMRVNRSIEDKPFFQVKMSDGNQPPYVYKGYTKHDKDAL